MGRNTPAPLEELTTLFLTRVFDKVELLTQLGRGIPAGSSVYFSTKKESFVKVRKFSPWFGCSEEHLGFLKFWFSVGSMLGNSDCYGVISSDVLCFKHKVGFWLHSLYLPRCKLWMVDSLYSRQWGFHVFLVSLYAHWAWTLLRVLPGSRDMEGRSDFTVCDYWNGFFGVCASMRSDVLLSRHSDYKPCFCYPLFGNFGGYMALRGVFSKKCYIGSVLCSSFFVTYAYCSSQSGTYSLLTPEWVQKPFGG